MEESSADDVYQQKGGYNLTYKCQHYDGKGRVAEWMKAQPSVVSDTDMSWSVVTSGPYMEMLEIVSRLPSYARRELTSARI